MTEHSREESELKAALRRRRGLDCDSVEDDPDDPGLPRSPPTSPTSLDVLNHGLKNSSRGAQSSCSDGSLLSIGSSENDEDSFGVLSRHSSKQSLIEGRHQVVDNEPAVGAAPLSHKAARHKISVRPKRTHGVTRVRKPAQALPSSLPTTPEVNEDCSVRSRVHNASFSPPFKAQQNQRPSSISFSNIETSITKTRTEWSEDRKNARKSLPEPGSQLEEKKEEPLLSRLFSSVRSGQQKGNDDVPKETPIARDASRASREKRKDPFKTPPGSKSSRQKSDPSRLSYVQDSSAQQSERNGSQRSSSVEGRLEGNPLEGSYHQSHQYQLNDSLSPSLREKGESVEERIEVRETNTKHSISMERQETKSVSASRLSSSYDCLGNNEILSETVPMRYSINSLESCEGRSSTDSLTTTLLPGIYIRSNHSLTKPKRTLQSQAMENITSWKEDQQHQHMLGRDTNLSGPLSLDSSLNAVQYEEEELRKSMSVDEVTVESDSKVDSSLTNDSLLPVSRPVTILRSVSVHSQSCSSRGSSGRSRKSSVGDDLESDSSLPRVSLRKVTREPSLKKPPPDETETEVVPEFMRIQLNRVQSKGNAVIFDTEQNHANNKILLANVKIDTMESGQKWDRNIVVVNDEGEKPKDHSEIMVEEKNMLELNAKKDVVAPFVNANVETTNCVVDVPTYSSVSSQMRGLSKDPIEELKRKDEKDEIVLRRPSVVDRAIVIDQTMNALPSSPVPKKTGDEPELFKVFARRSFKLKDVELDDTMEEELDSDVDKENHVPTPANTHSERDQQINVKSNEQVNAPNPAVAPRLPTLKSISSKRYSSGNSNSAFSNSTETKSTVIVLSGNNSAPTESSELKPSSMIIKNNESGSSLQQPTFKAKEKVLNASLYGRSQSLSPSTSNSKRSGVEVDGNFSSSSEDNVEVNNSRNDSSNRLRKVKSYSKSDANNYSPSPVSIQANQLKPSRKVDENEPSTSSSPKESDSNFNSVIIRRSVLTTKGDTSNCPSETSSIDGTQSPNSTIASKKALRGQAVVWPPRNQTVDSSESIEASPPPPGPDSTPAISISPVVSRSGLPLSKIVSSFKDTFSPSPISTDGNDSQSSNDEEFSLRGTKVKPAELRKRSTKEGGNTVLLAEARNTTFAHSFDTNSSPLALSYLGRGETPIKNERKGSVEEARNSLGGASEDWRVLVRQRREDRMKQTKSPEAEEIVMENRPSVSRNSKVLEMANNFQKLQVA